MSRGLDQRLEALAEAADIAEGRLDDASVQRARALVDRAGQRLGLGLTQTVVALAGPTGAGKSSVFNALVGEEVSRASALRPTTASATAAVWGDGAEPLLDWLEVARRHRLPPGTSDGLVLLDLPDFDSVEAAHRREFERVLALTALVVWIVDPEKYADAALHDRYLRPLATHRDTMLVALNQVDRLAPDALDAARNDLTRLLRQDGLDGVPVLALSAREHHGLGELQRLVAKKVAQRTAAVERLAADVTAAARDLRSACDDGKPGKIGRAEREAVVGALAGAAGVPTVVHAVDRAHRRRGALAAGWPFARWLRRLRPDPLRRLRLPDQPVAEGEAVQATSLPRATPVQRAQVSAAGRALAQKAAGDLQPPWPALLRDAALRSEDEVADRLDRAIAGVDLRLRPPRWWRLAGVLQTALAAVAAAGALWLVALVGLGFLRLDDVLPDPEVEGFPLPTLLLAVGLLGGLVVALAARLINGAGARRRARRAARALNHRVEEVAGELVVAPVEQELAARKRLCDALSTAVR